MTKEEFIENYCLKSNITEEFFNLHLEAKLCDCGEDSCQGWQAVSLYKTTLKEMSKYNSFIFSNGDNEILLEIKMDNKTNTAKIIFNKELFPEYSADDFAREFINIVEKYMIKR